MSTSAKLTAVVVCPGRGTYNKTELGYLGKYHADKIEFIDQIDRYRIEHQQLAVSDLDQSAVFRSAQHLTGDNASALIYACAVADFHSICRDKFDIVAVTGNSMGWYLALACADALMPESAVHVVNTMGTLMHKSAPGGQIIYPLVDENWQPCPRLKADYSNAIENVSHDYGAEIFSSINLGGMAIIAANHMAMKKLLTTLPPTQNRYPFALPHHGAFHSPLMEDISHQARQILPTRLFEKPTIPLIDGRGHIWQPYATDLSALHEYTLGYQIDRTYDFSSAIEVSVKEFAPDKIIILGPGSTLGAPTAQALIQLNWLDMKNKQDFKALQNHDPFLISMGMEEQRVLAVH